MKNNIMLIVFLVFVGCTANRGPGTFNYLKGFAVVKAEYAVAVAALSRPVSPVLHVERQLPAKVRLANRMQYEAERRQYVVEEMSFLHKQDTLLADALKKIGDLDSRGVDTHSVKAVQMYSRVLGDQREVGIQFKRVIEYTKEIETEKRGAEGKVFFSGLFAVLGPSPVSTSAFLKNVETAIQEGGDQGAELRQKLQGLREKASSKLSDEAVFDTFATQMLSDLKNKYPDEKWESIGHL